MEFCTIASGSSGNCIYVGEGDTHILVDCGISRKRIVDNLHEMGIKPEELTGIFITHEHTDHTQGLNVLSRQYEIPIYSTANTLHRIQAMDKGKPIPQELFSPLEKDRSYTLGDLTIRPFHISHDAADPVGYRIEAGRKSFAVATDMGVYDDYTVEQLRDLDGIVLEANHDICMLQVGHYPYPLKMRILGDRGHLSNESSGQLLCQILHPHMKHIVLGHLSKENNLPELALETVRLEVTLSSYDCKGEDLPMFVAKRESRSKVMTL